MPTKRWLATAMLVLLVGCMEDVEDESQQRKVELPEVFITVVLDPGISLRERRLSGVNLTHDCWQITNMRDEPLTIHRVAFNGEWDPPFLDATTWNPVSGPQTLTIGGTRLLPWKSNVSNWNYGKEVIYIDLYTDRGNFRYRPSEGFKALAD